jgi:hypothetical protein
MLGTGTENINAVIPQPSSTFALNIFSRTPPCVAVKPLMAPQTFHYFSTLPEADRELIWALAIRPKRFGAHFFTIPTGLDDAECSLLSQYRLHHPEVGSDLAAPQVPTSDDDNPERQLSWVKDNRSTYLMDYGLWAACRESRAAMEERYKVAGRRMMPEKDDHEIVKGSVRRYVPGPLDTSYFFSGGEWQRCLTYPKTDLFLLRPLDPGTFDWEYIYGFPFYNRTKSSENDAVHIALECDIVDTWSRHGPGATLAIEAVAGGLPYTDKLWFVDYSLRRRQRAGIPPPQNRYEFHGNGCILTEVRDGDRGWYRDWNSRADKREGEAPVSGDCFLWNLEYEVMDLLNRVERPSPEYTTMFDHRIECHQPDVGILAYEECDF